MTTLVAGPLTVHAAVELPIGAVEWAGRIAARAFAGPPWQEERSRIGRLRDRLVTDSRRCGFRFAWAEDAGRPVGFAYGAYGVGHAVLAAALSETGPVEPPPFELCELAVLPSTCGQGVGRALLDAVMTGTADRRCWLLTHPRALPALGLYRSRGWRAYGLLASLPGTTGPRLLMTR